MLQYNSAAITHCKARIGVDIDIPRVRPYYIQLALPLTTSLVVPTKVILKVETFLNTPALGFSSFH